MCLQRYIVKDMMELHKQCKMKMRIDKSSMEDGSSRCLSVLGMRGLCTAVVGMGPLLWRCRFALCNLSM